MFASTNSCNNVHLVYMPQTAPPPQLTVWLDRLVVELHNDSTTAQRNTAFIECGVSCNKYLSSTKIRHFVLGTLRCNSWAIDTLHGCNVSRHTLLEHLPPTAKQRCQVMTTTDTPQKKTHYCAFLTRPFIIMPLNPFHLYTKPVLRFDPTLQLHDHDHPRTRAPFESLHFISLSATINVE